MIQMMIGFAVGFLPSVVGWVVVGRQLAAERRIQARVDQIPVGLPGAYEPPAERALPGRRTHRVVDGEVA